MSSLPSFNFTLVMLNNGLEGFKDTNRGPNRIVSMDSPLFKIFMYYS